MTVLTPPRLVRLALHSPRPLSQALTVSVGETARRAVQGRYGQLFDGAASPLLSGKAADGSPLPGHRHTAYLPRDADADGLLDQLWLFAPGGFGPRELRALETLEAMPGLLTGGPIRLALLGWDDIPLTATRWQSITPFVPTRHYKERGAKRDTFPRHQLAAVNLAEELARRGLPAPTLCQPLPAHPHTGLPWAGFAQTRLRGAGRRGHTEGEGFTLTFAQPITGPLALGYACHFGLGQFAPLPADH